MKSNQTENDAECTPAPRYIQTPKIKSLTTTPLQSIPQTPAPNSSATFFTPIVVTAQNSTMTQDMSPSITYNEENQCKYIRIDIVESMMHQQQVFMKQLLQQEDERIIKYISN